jgi:hypothetical protein
MLSDRHGKLAALMAQRLHFDRDCCVTQPKIPFETVEKKLIWTWLANFVA